MLESFDYMERIKNARAFRLYVEELRMLESFGYIEKIKNAGEFRLYEEDQGWWRVLAVCRRISML